MPKRFQGRITHVLRDTGPREVTVELVFASANSARELMYALRKTVAGNALRKILKDAARVFEDRVRETNGDWEPWETAPKDGRVIWGRAKKGDQPCLTFYAAESDYWMEITGATVHRIHPNDLTEWCSVIDPKE